MPPTKNTKATSVFRSLQGGFAGAVAGILLGILIPWLLLPVHINNAKDPISWGFQSFEQIMQFLAMIVGAVVLGILGGLTGSAMAAATFDPTSSDIPNRMRSNGRSSANSATETLSIEQEKQQLKARLAELESQTEN
jgi:hypothetical protein